MILPKEESRSKDRVIRNQNLRIREFVVQYRQTVRDLELALWELHESSASSIAELRNLKRLSIRLDHPHTRYSGLDSNFWETSRKAFFRAILSLLTPDLESLGMFREQKLFSDPLLQKYILPFYLSPWKCNADSEKYNSGIYSVERSSL